MRGNFYRKGPGGTETHLLGWTEEDALKAIAGEDEAAFLIGHVFLDWGKLENQLVWAINQIALPYNNLSWLLPPACLPERLVFLFDWEHKSTDTSKMIHRWREIIQILFTPKATIAKDAQEVEAQIINLLRLRNELAHSN